MAVVYNNRLNVSNILLSQSAPTKNSDAKAGFAIGSQWFDEPTGNLYVCLDNTIAAARWVALSITTIVFSGVTKGQTVFPLTSVPTALNGVLMFINGIEYTTPADFTIVGQTLYWNNQFSIEVGDIVSTRFR